MPEENDEDALTTVIRRAMVPTALLDCPTRHSDRDSSVAAGWNDGEDAVVFERGADGVAVVGLVADQVIGPCLGERLASL